MTQPLPLSEERLDTPLGAVVLLTDGDGAIRALDFEDFAERTKRLLDRHYGGGGWSVSTAPQATHAAARLHAYFAGELSALDDLPVRTAGTAFQRDVWAALRRVPPGATASYADLAQAIGRPAAVRAAGMANGANPVAVVVPCHRVIGKSGALTGYAGGLERKRWLLQHERGG